MLIFSKIGTAYLFVLLNKKYYLLILLFIVCFQADHDTCLEYSPLNLVCLKTNKITIKNDEIFFTGTPIHFARQISVHIIFFYSFQIENPPLTCLLERKMYAGVQKVSGDNVCRDARGQW